MKRSRVRGARKKKVIVKRIAEKKKKPVVESKKYKKRQRWDAILDRLPMGVAIVGAEIGVLNGNTAHRILAARPLLTHYMIDPWAVPLEGSSYAKEADVNAQKPALEHEKAYQKTKKLTAFAGKRAVIMRMTSYQAAPSIEDHSLDFVFIDGDHSYEGVRADIKLWLPKVKHGGWIGGHDYDHPRLPGVTKAVDEAFPFGVELDDNRTWFVRVK